MRPLYIVLQAVIICAEQHPHIVTIVADDLGWNDVGFHGSNEVKTPNIDALAYHGLILNKHYTLPACTPSRCALLTGRYPITLGMQGFPLRAGEPRGLPFNTTLLPQQLKRLGYITHAVGKWHLGCCKKAFLPTFRGFDSHFGYWNGYIDYHDHHIEQKISGYMEMRGLDMHRGLLAAWEDEGQYATKLFSREAVSIIQQHNTSHPLYLYIGHLATHAPLQVPDLNAANITFSHITDPERRIFAEMLRLLDESVGEVVAALQEHAMLNNTIIVFISDNGAQPHGLHYNKGSNWPLRGTKHTLFEGGVRTPAVLWSSNLKEEGKISNNLFHISDWLPTLYSAAGGNVSDLGTLEGINQWHWIHSNTENKKDVPHWQPRTKILLNIDEVEGSEAMINGNWKLIRGSFKDGLHDGHTGHISESPRNVDQIHAALSSTAAHALQRTRMTETVTWIKAASLRSEATVRCSSVTSDLPTNFSGKPPCIHQYCLYNLQEDPCEVHNVAANNSNIISSLVQELDVYRRILMPQLNYPVDVLSDPAQFNNTWHPWLD